MPLTIENSGEFRYIVFPCSTPVLPGIGPDTFSWCWLSHWKPGQSIHSFQNTAPHTWDPKWIFTNITHQKVHTPKSHSTCDCSVFWATLPITPCSSQIDHLHSPDSLGALCLWSPSVQNVLPFSLNATISIELCFWGYSHLEARTGWTSTPADSHCWAVDSSLHWSLHVAQASHNMATEFQGGVSPQQTFQETKVKASRSPPTQSWKWCIITSTAISWSAESRLARFRRRGFRLHSSMGAVPDNLCWSCMQHIYYASCG